MSAADGARRALPAHPSREHLRKQAKRLAKDRALGLAEAQRSLAHEYGSANWAELMRRVDQARGDAPATLSPLAAAAKAGDAASVQTLLGAQHPVEGARGDGATPLWHACAGDAPAAARIAVAEALLSAGANPRRDDPGETALHAAARRGPLALVELLIRRDALEWQPDRKGRTPLQAAKRGDAADKAEIVALLDRPVIDDPAFRAAVKAIHRGDAAELARLIEAEPRLLRERIIEPDCYRAANRPQYFRDPKLFWFIANNPTLVKTMPANIIDVAEVMIARDVENADLDYALELTMTSQPAREQGLQGPLIDLLLRAGATPTAQAIYATLGHRELAPIQTLLDAGHPMSAAIAAAMGRTDRLGELLRTASADELQTALGMAVINGQTDAARMVLDAGADPNGFLPVHGHCTPLHTATLNENLELMELLVARGARTDIRDTLWDSTPLGWATHQKKVKAKAYLEKLASAGR